MPPMSISIVSVNEHRNLRQAFKVLRINQRVHSQWPQSTAEIQNAVFWKLFEYTTIPCPMHFRNESRLCMRPGMWIWGRICEWALTHFIFHLKWRHRIRQESRLPMKTLLRWNIDVRISKSDLMTTRLETIQRLYLGSTGPNTVRNVYGAVVVAQLTERLLPIPDHPGSNPVIGIFYWTIYCQLLVETTKIKRGNWTQDGRPWSTLGAGNEQPYWHCD